MPVTIVTLTTGTVIGVADLNANFAALKAAVEALPNSYLSTPNGSYIVKINLGTVTNPTTNRGRHQAHYALTLEQVQVFSSAVTGGTLTITVSRAPAPYTVWTSVLSANITVAAIVAPGSVTTTTSFAIATVAANEQIRVEGSMSAGNATEVLVAIIAKATLRS